MKSIQTIAIILWGIIFMVAAFILGQFLIKNDIFDVTTLFTISGDKEEGNTSVEGIESDDELKNDVIINKVGQETVRVGQNIAKDYFTNYYKEYVNYIMANADKYKVNKKISITDELASDYIFYALSRNLDSDKYTSQISDSKVSISEGNINSFIDKMFAKEISDSYKQDDRNGYDKSTKSYSIVKNEKENDYIHELNKIENITSNQIKLEFECKRILKEDKKTQVLDEKQINIYAVYRGGRYLVTEVEKLEK